MSEADLREGLRAAVGDEPPLRFDPDELIRRAQHLRRRRRALVAVAVATLALTGTALALPGAFEQRPGVDAAGGQVLTTTPAPASTPSPAPAPPMATVEPTGQRALVAPSDPEGVRTHLATYLGARLAEVVPNVKVVQAQFPDPTRDEPGRRTGWVRFVDERGPSQVLVRLVAPPLRVSREEFCAEAGCAGPVRREDGSYLASAPVPAVDGELVSRTVAHFRADGSVVQVTGYNFDPATGSAVRSEPALTVDQLVALATDPKLGPF
ncbi:hypothetical protein ACFXGA_19780 [Actinosynnema sp. NPDC059335]|uniref:hypothetical protein n=1 Tax=Actinosynnema sp. NPDC059335 TaxID=3346804 RepID=UPI00366A95C6